MPLAITYTGPVLVNYNLVDLGYSRDGAQIRIQPQWDDIKSDCTGGERGVPLDRQFLGATARISLDLTKYELAEMQRLSTLYSARALNAPAETAGGTQTMGTLQRQENQGGPLLLSGVTHTIDFENAFVVDGMEWNVGTRASAYRISFEAWMDDYQETLRLMTYTNPEV